jgi:endonuclease-3
VRDAIRSAGLAEVRAPRLLAILRRLQADRGELSLDFLARETVPAAQRYLESLPGVGPKTAACVLLFAFGRAVFPVDTHVARIARRLGWAPDRASPEAIQALLGPRVPPSLRYALHVNLIAHGRATCRARNPRCPGCPILRLCPTGRGRERS